MPLFRQTGGCAKAGLFCAVLLAGCTSASKRAGVARDEPLRRPLAIAASKTAAESAFGTAPGTATGAKRVKTTPPGRLSEIKTASYDEPLDAGPVAADGFVDARPDIFSADLFSGRTELALPELVREVEQRNPSLQASLAAWAAAAERYPQVVALEDPVFQSMFAPGTFSSSSSTQASYLVGIAQKIPWAGKRALRGQIAQAEATAASHDSQDVRLRLAETTRLAFFEYYLVRRDLELNTANRKAVREYRETANAKYVATQVTEQDVLQADVELATLESRRIELEQNDKVAVARINTLLHRQPQLSLPPPPHRLEVSDSLPDVEALRQAAVLQRPDLTAQAARIRAEQAAVALACKEFYPDFEFMGRYDQFWTDVVQRPQVGMYVNIPLNQSRRQAAVREAIFRVSKMQAEYDSQVDGVRNDVQAGFARLDGSRKTVRLYAETTLSAAEANVASANAGYEAGRVDFLRLVEAQRQLIGLQEKYQEAVAEYHRRHAELERVVGGPLSDASDPGDGTGLRLDE